MKKLILFTFTILISNLSFSKNRFKIQKHLIWYNSVFQENENSQPIVYKTFSGATFDHKNPQLPFDVHRIPLEGNGTIQILLKSEKASNISIDQVVNTMTVSDNYVIESNIVNERGLYYANVFVLPVKKNGNVYQKLDVYTLDISFSESESPTLRDPNMTTTSVLSEGTFYKIEIPQEGVYKIDGFFLKDELKIDLSTLDPVRIQLFGNIGGKLPEANIADQPDDLNEIPLVMNSGELFTEESFFTFYAEGPDRWTFDYDNAGYSYNKNIYDNNNHVFLKIGNDIGQRVQTIQSIESADYNSQEFDYLQIFEDDRTNLLGAYVSTEGTGQEWYGDYFATESKKTYTDKFDFSDIASSGEGNIKMSFAARGDKTTTTSLLINNTKLSQTAPGVSLGDIESDYAKKVVISSAINLKKQDNKISVEFTRSTSEDEGWLDFIQLDYRKSFSNKYNQLRISDYKSTTAESASFPAYSDVEVWKITELNNPKIIAQKNNMISFPTEGKLQSFYYVKNGQYLTPGRGVKINNQNLHSLSQADMVIVYYGEFKEAATKLANHRKSHSKLKVELIDIADIYNEFSSGRKDPTALRDFSRMLHVRDDQYRYLLLVGDGSYDYRNITPKLQDHNFTPIYETKESLDPINGFPADDYYGLLSDDEGENLRGALDVAVGRLPVTSSTMAMDVVNKIINYDTNKDTYGDWRLKIAFAADDEDSNLHVNQSDQLAESVEIEDPNYNQSKIYFDSYVQESTPGGERYPAASDAINTAVQKGLLVLNYLGHGGPKGWAQERVLKTSDIETWNNKNRLPLLITATCSFTGYDDPSIVSAGEVAIQKANGGVIGLFTTVRAVYASDNFRLTKAVYDELFKKQNGKPKRLGDIIMAAKNQNTSINVKNDRKFALIGDPAQRLASPTYNIETTSINGHSPNQKDTLSALQKVTITGSIIDENGTIVSDFNGDVFPTVYDKQSTLSTLANDSRSYAKDFEVYRNVLFKGQATVTNGEFSFTFIIPKDINYDFGKGRISYYAVDINNTDAAGNFNDIIIGGTFENAIVDNEGPSIELYMNNKDFVSGQETGNSPTLLAYINDDYGINVSGTSIGHDITAILDGDSKNSIILNEAYKANKNDFTSGVVEYPLSRLSLGTHTLTLKAWDISNNSATATIDFIVVENDNKVISNLFNSPNPFKNQTTISFDVEWEDGQARLDIYSSKGELVQSTQIATSKGNNQVIIDDQRDENNQKYEKLSSGIYFYKLTIFSPSRNKTVIGPAGKMIKIK